MQKIKGKTVLKFFAILYGILFIGMILLFVFDPFYDKDCTIFTSMDEWSFLDDRIIADSTYEDTLVKKYPLKESKSFVCSYAPDQEIVVFAYVFENESDCQAYVSERTGNLCPPYKGEDYRFEGYYTEAREGFLDSSPSWHIVFSGNRCYYVFSTTSSNYWFTFALDCIHAGLSEKIEPTAIPVK